ncbi:MAG: isocitrate lyase/PEP mutase family protein [Gammaproteobacteria bacterium]
MNNQVEKCNTLAALHKAQNAWIIPNPWDVGSAVDLQETGFKALATSSAAFAYTLGRKDGGVTLDEKLAHCRAIVANTMVPVSVDFEDGYSNDPAQVAANIEQLIATGVAGCSIEDFSRVDQKIFGFDHAVERMHAVMEAVSTLEMPFQIVARAENLLRKVADIDETIKRLQAYSAAGAHVLYAPGLTTLDQIKRIAAETDKPLNVLSPFLPDESLEALSDAGATRISLGSALHQKMRSKFLTEIRGLMNSGRAC